MTKILVICLGLILLWSASETFSVARRIGRPDSETFFLFSTKAGNYVVRHDGMVEFASPQYRRRRYSFLKLKAKGRIERVHYLEHEGDVLVLSELTTGSAHLARMDQKTGQLRWATALNVSRQVEAPIVDGDVVIVDETIKVSKSDGRLVRQD